MFDVRTIINSMLGYAPQFLITNFSSVIMGIVIAYEFLLFFFGHPPFIQRVGELLFITALGYWGARGTRYGITRLVCLMEGTHPEKGINATSSLGAKPLHDEQEEAEKCDSKCLD